MELTPVPIGSTPLEKMSNPIMSTTRPHCARWQEGLVAGHDKTVGTVIVAKAHPVHWTVGRG